MLETLGNSKGPLKNPKNQKDSKVNPKEPYGTPTFEWTVRGTLTLSVPGGMFFHPPHGKSDAIFLWVEIFISTLDEFFNWKL